MTNACCAEKRPDDGSAVLNASRGSWAGNTQSANRGVGVQISFRAVGSQAISTTVN